MGLSQTQIGTVRRLIEAVPDTAIRTLESALASGRNDNSIAAIHDMVSEELVERRVRACVFSPISNLCGPPKPLLGVNFPNQALALLWRALKAEAGDAVGRAVRAVMSGRGAEDGPPIFDELCVFAFEGLSAAETPHFRAVIERLEAHGPDAAEQFIRIMNLAPLARAAIPRLGVWIRNVGGEQAPAVRLAFKDATETVETNTPIFMELLASHLEEPWQVLRLISVVLDKPSDRYLASSELAAIGERLLANIDQRITAIVKLDLARGREGGAEIATSILVATSMMAEFEQGLTLSREGPWGSRIVEQKKALAGAVEGKLREVDAAVGAALPWQPVRYAGRSVRQAPKLTQDPDPKALAKAQCLLALLDGTRMSAGNGGFGSMRLKIIEGLETRLDQYAEDLLELLHSGEGPPAERIRAFLDITAQALGMVRNPEAGEIVRRRAAAA